MVGAHILTRLTCHLVWVTKYRYQVLKGEVQVRCRDLLLQDCESMEIEILKGVVSKDHVHMHIEYPAKRSISEIMKQFKGRSSRLLQKEFPGLKKRYWGQHLWATGYSAWSTGNITDEMVQEYLEHHRKPTDPSQDNFLLE
ncbi:MAG: IS200/IS605 family transposase [Phaeodactylibacter sp.]|nr:IS200/IS605 family transposase [Phaeodactylibacter sp.]MCB9304601.1 IS200/IS605 family transposase [Lewinellaceae bacterium]